MCLKERGEGGGRKGRGNDGRVIALLGAIQVPCYRSENEDC